MEVQGLRTVAALLGTERHLGRAFAPDKRQSGFTVNEAQRVDSVLAMQLYAAAEQLASEARPRFPELAPCATPAEPEICARAFIASFGARAYRRPLMDEESAGLLDVFRAGAGENAIFLLKLAGSDQSRHAMIREMQRDPVSRKPLHIDFVRVLMDVKITLNVPIEIVGIAKGVKTDQGILDVVTREIEIECLPTDIPENIAVDISELMLNQSIRVKDLVQGVKWRAMTEGETMIVHVVMPKAEESAQAADAAAAEAAPAAAAEPEVIKKGKEEKDEKEKK